MAKTKSKRKPRPKTKFPQIAVNLQKWLEKAGYSGLELSTLSQVPQANISRLLVGEVSNPTVDTAQRLARTFGRTVSDLIGESHGEVQMKPNRLIPVIDDPACKKWARWARDIPKQAILEYEAYYGNDPRAFYVIARGPAMTSPFIPEGTLLLVEPGSELHDRDLVLTRSADGMAVRRFHRLTQNRFALVSLDHATSLKEHDASKTRRLLFRITQITVKL